MLTMIAQCCFVWGLFSDDQQLTAQLQLSLIKIPKFVNLSFLKKA